jgi:hypothetical protein
MFSRLWKSLDQRARAGLIMAAALVAMSLVGVELPDLAFGAPLVFGLIPNLPGLTLVEEFKSAVAVALTGTTVETVLATFNIPGGLLGANGEIEIEGDFTETNNANSKTVQVRLGGLGGTSIFFGSSTGVAGRSFRGTVGLRNSAAVQRARFLWATDVGSPVSIAGIAAAVNLQNDVAIVITGTLAVGTDTLTLEKFKMRFYR